MKTDSRTPFLVFYIQSLKERTRDEKTGTKFGFDWVIYNLLLREGWVPHRLPFFRNGADQTSVPKSETEFGIDVAFLSPDGMTLRIFVLKDEPLRNRTWGTNSFDNDLRSASSPDLSSSQLVQVSKVEVILAYNKDEDADGLKHFENLVASLPKKIRENVSLEFDRWNLTTIVEKAETTLLTPELLPQKFFVQFAYICSQFKDFVHGSDEWTYQLIPNWQSFLSSLFKNDEDVGCVHLLPVVLIILQQESKDGRVDETGWIDLMEWGMLSSWKVFQSTKKQTVREAVFENWLGFYLAELERYYRAHSEDFATMYALDVMASGSYVDPISSAIVSNWHLARLGILGIGAAEVLNLKENLGETERFRILNEICDLQVGLLSANPSSMRPLLDIHHIQLFLTWHLFRVSLRVDDLEQWFQMLINRLFVRRSGKALLPFMEAHNRLDFVLEYAATGIRPPEFCDSSSVYLMCLLELVCSLPPNTGDRLLQEIHRRLVLACTDCGTAFQGTQPIDLMLWWPSDAWEDGIFTSESDPRSECIQVIFEFSNQFSNPSGNVIRECIEKFVEETRRKRQFRYQANVPLSVIVLACLKHGKPLPPELWRRIVFPVDPVSDLPLKPDDGVASG